MKNFRKFLAVFLSIAMVMCSSLPSLASENNDATSETSETTKSKIEEQLKKDLGEERANEILNGEPEEEEETESTVGDDILSSKEDETEPTVGDEPEEDEETTGETVVDEPEESEETTVGESTTSPEEETESTVVDEPEEESVGAKLGEPEEEDETESEEETETTAETLSNEEINDEKADKLYGDGEFTAYVYYMQYNTATKKYEDKYATIPSGQSEEDLNDFIDELWETEGAPFEDRLSIWYLMSSTDTYDHFKNSGSYNGNKNGFKQAYNAWNASPTDNLYLGAGFGKCSVIFYYLQHNPSTSSIEKGYSQTIEGRDDIEDFFSDALNGDMVAGAKGVYLIDVEDPMDPINDYDEYYDGDIDYECTVDGLTQAYNDWNDNPTENLVLGAIYNEPFMYWKVDGSTIYYYNTAGEGRTEVAFDAYGIDYGTSINKDAITKAVFVNDIEATDTRRFFFNFNQLTEITGLDKLDTANVTSMDGMFMDCQRLSSIDFGSNFDTSKVTSMEAMFAETGLVSLDLTSFDTSNVTNMEGMFGDSNSLVSIQVSDRFNVENVTQSDNMFAGCSSLVGEKGTPYDPNHTDVNYAHIDGGLANPGYFSSAPFMYWKVEGDTIYYYEEAGEGRTAVAIDVNGINYGSLDVSTITKAVFVDDIDATNAKGFFKSFISLESITNFDKLSTSEVTDMSYMFYGCIELTSISFGVDFDTSNVTIMDGMFYATGMRLLDLRDFETKNVVSMREMFSNSDSLETIWVSEDGFNVEKVTNSINMFAECPLLEGEKGTTYGATKANDATFAHIDEGSDNPGYFSSDPASRSTLDTSGVSKLYIVGFDGTNKVIHSLTRENTVDDLNAIFANLEKPDPTCNITGYYDIASPLKDAKGRRVFLTNNDLKETYDETLDTVNYDDDDLRNNFSHFKSETEPFDLYYGVCYSPFISKIKGVSGITIPEIDNLAYFKVGDKLGISGATITVEYSDGSSVDIDYDDDPTNFSVVPETFSKGDNKVSLKYKGVEYVLSNNVYVWDWDYDAFCVLNINILPYKTLYVEGEIFDASGLVVNTGGIFSNVRMGKTLEYNVYKDHFVIPTTPLVAGTTSVTIQCGGYSGCTYDIPIEVIRKGTSIKVDSKANKNYFDENDTLRADDLNGLSVTVTYSSDPTTKTFTYPADSKYFAFEPDINNALTSADEKIKVTVSGVSLDYPIVVLPSGAPKAVTITKKPDKTNYIVGETFDPTGLEVEAEYDNNIKRVIEFNAETENYFTFNPDIAQIMELSDTSVEVSFKGSPKTSFPVTVRKHIRDISVVGNPTTTIYSVGDTFDPTGLVVHVMYEDFSEDNIIYDSDTASGFEFDPPIGQTLTSSDVGLKVVVKFGNSQFIAIDGMETILPECFAYIDYDPNNDFVDILAFPNAALETAKVKSEFEKLLDSAMANGASGFHIISVAGVNNAKLKYDKYTTKTLTRDQALARFDDYVASGATGNLFIAASFNKPSPTPTPTPRPSSGGGSSGGGGGASDPTRGPMGDLTKNGIPQSSLLLDHQLINLLRSYPQNLTMARTNVTDVNGNKGFGYWQRIPGTSRWYFLSGNYGSSGSTGNVGLLANGWFKLEWDGQEHWFHFGADGQMTLGWHQEGDKIYYLQSDLTDNWYGRRVTGTHTIDGRVYTFDENGVLIS